MGLHSIILQLTNGIVFVVTGEMRIAQGHLDVLVSHQFFDGWEVHSRHDQTTYKSMAKRVKSAMRNTCFK